MDRVLRISGCDPVEVNRKGRLILYDVLMRTRLVIISNEMPNFRDNSGAIVARYLPLLMTENFEGREDINLGERLAAELPSILNWAIQGRAMLEQDGRFITPQSALHLLDDAKSLASPVAEFVSEECTLCKDADVPVDELWGRWKEWAERNGHKPGTKQLFGRNLKPATNYKVRTERPRGDDGRYRLYRGIELKLAPIDGKSF
jgi:putative DNA primase/helicase